MTKTAIDSLAIRARVGHPIADADGHAINPTHEYLDYLKKVGGPQMVADFQTVDDPELFMTGRRWRRMTPEERRRTWTTSPAWWVLTQTEIDRAAAMVPKLLYQRLDEIGID